MKVDIVDRTTIFATNIVKFTFIFPKTPAGFALANQIARSGTSIGANIQEAQSALSKKDFILSMNRSLKEARETNYWLKVIRASNLIKANASDTLLNESEELVKVLASIVKKSRLNS